MQSRREISMPGRMPFAPSNKAFFFQPPLCALIILGVIAFGSTIVVSGQETPKPPLQTQPSPSPAAQPPPDQAPVAPPPAPVALYNLLQKKSVVFPDIAYGTERLSAGQKFQLFVDNSVSVDSVTWAVLGSAVGQATDSPTGYGQEWGGYGKRFGSDMAPGGVQRILRDVSAGFRAA